MENARVYPNFSVMNCNILKKLSIKQINISGWTKIFSDNIAFINMISSGLCNAYNSLFLSHSVNLTQNTQHNYSGFVRRVDFLA